MLLRIKHVIGQWRQGGDDRVDVAVPDPKRFHHVHVPEHGR